MAKGSINTGSSDLVGYTQAKEIGQMQADIQNLKKEVQELKEAMTKEKQEKKEEKARNTTFWLAIAGVVIGVLSLLNQWGIQWVIK